MPETHCPECQGTLRKRTLPGFYACSSCGKVVIKKEEVTALPKKPDLRDPAAEAAEMMGAELGEVEVPDYAEVMIGWRAWGVNPGTPDYEVPKLLSMNSTLWTPREPMVAECAKAQRTKKEHQIAAMNCSCGLYAAKTLRHLMSMAYHEYDADRKGLFHVVGPVKLWGHVVEGSQGWRAEKGYPQELYVPYEAWRLAPRLRAAYGVPVKLKNILKVDQREAS